MNLFAMASNTTSFQKKAQSKLLNISGTKPSLYNNQLLISTGVPSLDSYIGGGLAVGTVLLVEEDVYNNYSRLLLRYYCAEAVMSGHALMLSSLDADPQQIVDDLPAPIIDDPSCTHQCDNSDGVPTEMKIAWRYQSLPQHKTSHDTKFGHYYDLSRSMEPDVTRAAMKTLVSDRELEMKMSKSSLRHKYGALLNSIKDEVDRGCFGTLAKVEKRNILRIGIHSLGSPQWSNNEMDIFALSRFLLGLRAIMRSAFAVCLVTIPTHLFQDPVAVSRIVKLCDTVIHLESFDSSRKEKNSIFSDYHGLLNIVQLPRLNSLTCHMPETLDLAFKLRRKRFTIEKLHLPPELSESASRSQEESSHRIMTDTSCGGSSRSSNLDF